MNENDYVSFQSRVDAWLQACFGPVISSDRVERNHRFLEEALELVQACGATKEEALALVDYVYERPVGEKSQEVGGVMLTLAALCTAHGMYMREAGNVELRRCWDKVDVIREKQRNKPKNSPLPASPKPSGWFGIVPCGTDVFEPGPGNPEAARNK